MISDCFHNNGREHKLKNKHSANGYWYLIAATVNAKSVLLQHGSCANVFVSVLRNHLMTKNLIHSLALGQLQAEDNVLMYSLLLSF